MAGLNEIVSPFLKSKMNQSGSAHPEDSAAAWVIRKQYLIDRREAEVLSEERSRHYEATLLQVAPGEPPAGVERLYKRSVVILLSNICASNCRWCLRARYGQFRLSAEDLVRSVDYCAAHPELREVLVSGGDPLMTPNELELLLDLLSDGASNIDTVRIGTRVPLQAPQRVDKRMLNILNKKRRFRVEIALHINHAKELFSEVKKTFDDLREARLRLYCQTVLLKGLNDNIRDLIELYDELRAQEIEPHYLFHSVPMQGMSHTRTSVKRGLNLINELTNSGAISGRVKPKYAIMSDIGKIVLQQGVIADQRDNKLLLRSNYSYEERLRWNPDWQLPASALVEENGLISVWYLDALDDFAGTIRRTLPVLSP
jgi:lysine 2,3-aminomutase